MPQRRAEYRLSPAATQDLGEIWVYTLNKWGIDQADRYTDRLITAFEQLVKNRSLGSPCNHIREGYRRRQVGEHAIYYRLTDYGIAIIRVLHARMDTRRHL
jgi:toxin ParE1/3/4